MVWRSSGIRITTLPWAGQELSPMTTQLRRRLGDGVESWAAMCLAEREGEEKDLGDSQPSLTRHQF